MFLRHALILAAIGATFQATAQGVIDGYVKKKGNADVALSYTFEYTPVYLAGRSKVDITRVLNSVAAFATYGISDRFNVVGNLPFINLNLQDGGVHLKHLTASLNFNDGLRLDFVNAVGIRAPLSKYETETANAIGQRAVTIPVRSVLQMNFSSGFFFNLTSGYNYSFAPVPSSVPASVKIGLAKSNYYADAWFDYQYGIGGKDYRGTGELAPSTFRELGVSYSRVGGVFYYSLKSGHGIFIGGAYTVDGRNTGIGGRVSTGYAWKL